MSLHGLLTTYDAPATQPVDQIRGACARVAARARHVGIRESLVPPYAAALRLELTPDPTARALLTGPTRELEAAYWLTLDAINFGSGWFPTLRKLPGRSGYQTIAAGVRARFSERGPWSATELAAIDTAEVAAAVGQEAQHPLISRFTMALRDLGAHLLSDYDGSFAAVVDAADGSAVQLVRTLAAWRCFADVSRYEELEVPFYKRAQIAAADLDRAAVASFGDLNRLTMFADNLVPHVLRLDRILRFDDELVARIEREELIEHGSPEEVEIRACAVHAVELIVAAARGGAAERGPRAVTAATVDQILWNRGQRPFYKASPRHRSRCTAY